MEIGLVLVKAITSKTTFRTFCILVFLFSAPIAAQNPKAKKQLDAAFTAFNLAEFPDALGLTKKAIKIDPSYADAY
jgi:hypothetical protein